MVVFIASQIASVKITNLNMITPRDALASFMRVIINLSQLSLRKRLV